MSTQDDCSPTTTHAPRRSYSWRFFLMLLSTCLFGFSAVLLLGVKQQERRPRTSPNLKLHWNEQHLNLDATELEPIELPHDDEKSRFAKQPLCSRAQLRKGEWVKREITTAPYYVPDNDNDSDVCNKNLSARSPWITYDWTPFNTSCKLKHFTKRSFCQVAAAKTIQFLGDSILLEAFQSLVYLLSYGDADIIITTGSPMNDDTFIARECCNHNTRVLYQRLDPGKLETILDNNKPDVLVLNRGGDAPHSSTSPDDDVLLEEFNQTIQMLAHYQQQFQKERRKPCRIMYQTTAPGHANCWEYQEPSNNVEAMEEFVATQSLYDDAAKNYHWWNSIKHQNELLLGALQNQTTLISYEVMDGYDMMILRPDQHKHTDCWHSCLPGKVDTYSQLLLHYLHMTPEQVMK